MASVARADDGLTFLETSKGTRFAIRGEKPAAPAPTLFVFANEAEITLTAETYGKIAMILEKQGYVCVSMNLPLHPGSELEGWAEATRKNEPWVPDYIAGVSEVLDYLIEQGYTDPQNVAVAGTSRGGFMAMQIAAADSRVKCAIGFVPVTDLTALTEFAELKDNPAARALSLDNIVERLAGRSIFISIGNDDDRVDTDKAIEFTRKLVAKSIVKLPPKSEQKIDVELHVMPWLGHGGLDVISAHDVAAAWLAARTAAQAPDAAGGERD